MSDAISRRQFFTRTTRGAAVTGLAAAGAGAALLGEPEAQAEPRPARRDGQRIVEIPSLCEMCFWRCGILGQVANGKLIGVRGNPGHPQSRGKLCARGNAGWLVHTDPDRLTHPLIRTGVRGEGKFRRASWDEALDYVATRMIDIRERHGAAAMALAPHGQSAGFMKSVIGYYGSPTFSISSYGQCRGPRVSAFKATFGMDVGSPERLDFEQTRLIVLIGSHLGENVHTSQVHEFADALDRGAELVVVDPRFSVAASKATEYLPIKPGTDTALLLAWMHVIITERLYDADYVARHTTGIAELTEHVKDLTPEWAARLTELPVEQIRATARMMGRARPAVIVHPGRHVTWYGDDFQRERAIGILMALLGSWARPGGTFLPSPVRLGACECPPRITKSEEFPIPGGEHPLAEDGLPAQLIVEAMLTGKPRPVRGLMIYGQNVIQSWPQPERTREALRRLDLVVTVDILPTEPVLFSDVVLPEASYLERHDSPVVVGSAKQPFVAVRQPIVPPPGEAQGPFWIARELAQRLGETGCLQCPDVESTLDRALRPLGTDLASLRHTGVHPVQAVPLYLDPAAPHRFPTPTGKIEIHSAHLAGKQVDPLPRFKANPEPPAGTFRLLYGRSPAHSFGRTQNNPLLCEIDPVNRLWINDAVAARLGIADGDAVELLGADGKPSLPLPAKVTPGIRPDCVYMVHGFGSRSRFLRLAYQRGASDTDLMVGFTADPETGSTGMRGTFVGVRPAARKRRWPNPLASLRPRRGHKR
jgi:thiosulfate reductase/polysulfide reductase chain A